MRILVFHGYLLHGTGSNVYNANVAAALVRAGHQVHLLCQDRDPFDLEWVDAAGDWDGGALDVRVRREPVRATVYRPDIGGVLPVYVADRYDGVQARPFPDLSDEEIDVYVAANVAAVREVAAAVRPDVALANHLVMGPQVLSLALEGGGTPYAVKIHGSALEYVVKPHQRFLPHARRGLAGARGVLVGSRHTAESLWAAMDEPGLRERTVLGPPGVDVERFAPRSPAAARAGVQALRTRLATMDSEEAGGSSFARDPREAARALASVDLEHERVVVFVGKLIASKGVELLLAAWPLVAARVPDARLVVVGFGAFRAGLQELAGRLAAGDLDAASRTRTETGADLPLLRAFLEDLPDPDAYRAAAAASLGDRVAWTGRLDHDELAELLPAADAMVVPSTFPEAFGMVAAEAAACGALPVVARHSGLEEVARELAGAAPDEAEQWLSFQLGPDAVPTLAGALTGWLQAPEDVRAATRAALVDRVQALWSWDGVARGVVAAARGQLDGLPRP